MGSSLIGNSQISFSVIVVTLNAEDKIKRCLDSLQFQSFKDFEIINIDGGSNDATLKFFSAYPHLKIRSISENDKGLYFAMNKGISLAKGKIIAILNSDDYYLPDTLQIVFRNFQNNPKIDVLAGSTRLSGKVLQNPNLMDLSKEMIPHPSLFVKRDCYVKYGVFNTKFRVAADYEFVLRIAKEGVTIQKINDLLAVMTPGGFSSRNVFRSIVETTILQSKYNNWNFTYTLVRLCKYILGTYMRKIHLSK
jgi:glycosyltransferase involved in cell wall biosynthesis